MSDRAADILVLGHDHFDPMWRRCFLADAVYEGVTVRSYAEIEERVLDAWLALAPRGYSFTEGQAAVIREWLRRDPRRAERLRAEIARGTFGPVQAGETVQDTNLATAEGLVRNFLVAMPLWRELGIEDHPGMEIAWLEDAFGNSANYPQVLRGIGCRVAAKLSYRFCPGPVWTGIDGTAIPVLDRVPLGWHGSVVKHPPCSSCAGLGCAACGGSGLRIMPMLDGTVVERELKELVAQAANGTPKADGYVVGGEETLPEAAIADAVDAAASACPAGVGVRFGTWSDLWQRHRERLLAAAEASQDGPTVELNPAMPGCMVTRRLTKARSRAIAYRLVEAESALADAAWRAGTPAAPPPELQRAWQLVAFSQFHDAITGTHIDSAYRELMGFLDEAEAIARRHAPPAQPTVAPAPVWRPHHGGEDHIRLGALDLRFDRIGITSVAADGHELLRALRTSPSMHELRVGELVLESDFGDAWGQRIAPCGDSSHRGLGEFHETVEVASGADAALRWRGRYRGGHRKVRRLAWTVEVRASADGRRLDYTADVDWDAESKRIRAVFGVPSTDPDWIGEIPFGHIARRFDAARTDWSLWKAHQNEYPILHWAQHRLADGAAVALIADGLPCTRWQPGRFDLSLLRSPEFEFCQVEPAGYDFWDNDGQRDAGRHLMRWSLWPAARAQPASELTAAGYAYNRPEFIAPPFTIGGSVIATAWKPSEDGRDWVLRLQETSGSPTRLTLGFAEDRTVTPCDLLERPGRAGSIGSPSRGRDWAADLHAFGIATLRIR